MHPLSSGNMWPAAVSAPVAPGVLKHPGWTSTTAGTSRHTADAALRPPLVIACIPSTPTASNGGGAATAGAKPRPPISGCGATPSTPTYHHTRSGPCRGPQRRRAVSFAPSTAAVKPPNQHAHASLAPTLSTAIPALSLRAYTRLLGLLVMLVMRAPRSIWCLSLCVLRVWVWAMGCVRACWTAVCVAVTCTQPGRGPAS
jgi:hypothetical protein